MTNEAIKLAIEKGGYKLRLIVLPKGATIVLWLCQKAQFLGIKVNALHRLENAMLVVCLMHEFTITQNLGSTLATGTTGILKSTDISLAIKKVNKILEHRSLSGLANDLGITKEGVQRLIWLLGDAQNTRNGSELSSSKMTSLVRNAILRERILKLTTIQFDLQPLLTKKELTPTSEQWRVNAYGIKRMGEPYVGNVTA